ncbi:MAG: hypothetical protein H6965_03275 [Chromatiaceae bacterium]|nr:hypothetical protein [Chromatiaceae bacterium]
MFKDYKEIFKNLREAQEQLWNDSMASFSGNAFQQNLQEWQQKTLEGVNEIVGQAISQSLELQQQWLDQWAERIGSKKLSAKLFSELSAEARDITQRWLESQNQLRDQWLRLIRESGSSIQPGFTEWEGVVQQSIERQMDLLNDWSKKADFKELSGKEINKLSEQIVKSMQKSIETHQQLWSPWFKQLGTLGEPSAETKKEEEKSKTNASATDQAEDDLKRIAGIGAGLEKKLKARGITTIRQIAELSDADVADLEREIIRFSGRIKREQWVEQAKQLVG